MSKSGPSDLLIESVYVRIQLRSWHCHAGSYRVHRPASILANSRRLKFREAQLLLTQQEQVAENCQLVLLSPFSGECSSPHAAFSFHSPVESFAPV